MQNKGYGYSINPKGEKFVFDKYNLDDLSSIAPVFEFYGVFKKDKMESTNAIVIKGKRAVYDRAEFLKDNYGIEYNDRYDFEEIYYVRYFFKNNIRLSQISKIKEKFEEVYGIEIDIGISVPLTSKQDGKFQFITHGILELIIEKKHSDGGAGSLNNVQLNTVNIIPIREVIDKLNIVDVKIDDVLNIDVAKGNVFGVASEHYGSVELAMDFFNEEYGTDFTLASQAIDTYKTDGVSIAGNSVDILEKDNQYFKFKEDGSMERITDFKIRVHSRKISIHGEIEYNVTLINKDGIESVKLIWENTSNRGKLSDFVQKFGNFHFFGNSNDVTKLHALVSKIQAPAISQIIGYGWHGTECVFGNGIWDSKRREFFETQENEGGILYKSNGDGIIVVDAIGNRLDISVGNRVSRMKIPNTAIDKAKFLKTIKQYWSDDTGMVLYLMACSILGSANLRKEVPMYYFRGITETGKTTMSEMLQKMVGYPMGSAETFEGTLFTALTLLASSNNLPVFFSEGRMGSRQIKDKISMFRSSYDKTVATRGRSDMSSVQFPLTAIAVMEGEEMLDDGATRTRCIQFRPNKNAKISKAVFDEKYKESAILEYFVHSYLSEVDFSKYEKYMRDGLSMFSGIAGSRNTYNISHMYASAMCYNQAIEDEIVGTLSKILAIQAEDQEQNGTSIDIIKSISAFIQKKEYPVYFNKEGFVISWESIQEYARKYKQELSLKISSYREHLDALGYIIDFYEVKEMGIEGAEMMVEGPLFKYNNIDKRLLCNSDIYAEYKKHVQRVI